MNDKDLIPTDYKDTLIFLKHRISKARHQSLKAINSELINLYWDIGKLISQKSEDGWGNNVVNKLSLDLESEFSGVTGFSKSNLFRMRFFYKTYVDDEKVAQVVRQLPWGQNIVLIASIKDPLIRSYYANYCLERGWGRNTLIENIKQETYKQFINNQTNFLQTVPAERLSELAWEFKDEYSFDFLSLTEEHKEREVEELILKNITKTLKQLGADFAFMGNQFRLEVDDKEYFVDLLFLLQKIKMYGGY